MQQLWFAIQRLEWARLVLVPGRTRDARPSRFGRPSTSGQLAMGDRLRLLDARGVKLDRTAPLILDMSGATPVRPPERRGASGCWS